MESHRIPWKNYDHKRKCQVTHFQVIQMEKSSDTLVFIAKGREFIHIFCGIKFIDLPQTVLIEQIHYIMIILKHIHISPGISPKSVAIDNKHYPTVTLSYPSSQATSLSKSSLLMEILYSESTSLTKDCSPFSQYFPLIFLMHSANCARTTTPFAQY